MDPYKTVLIYHPVVFRVLVNLQEVISLHFPMLGIGARDRNCLHLCGDKKRIVQPGSARQVGPISPNALNQV